MSQARLVLLGAGLIGREHARLVAEFAEARLVALADPSPSARGYAEQIGVTYYCDYERMLEAEIADGAIIALPNYLHVPAALACIARGIACLLEKPVADTVAAARLLVEASEASGVPVLVGHHRRHSPDIKEASRLVRSGALGDLVTVSGMCLFNKPDGYFDAAWRQQPGGGPLLINLIHDIDTLRFLCGEIESVQAFTSNAVRGFAVEDTASLILRFASGVLGSFVISDCVASPWAWEYTSGQALYFPHEPGASLFLGGRRGSLSLSDMTLWRHIPADGDWQTPFVKQRCTLKPSFAYANQLAHFISVCARREAPLISALDAMLSLGATLAADAASRAGAAVVVADYLESHGYAAA
ncbi:MAG: Gfo/Idh/MocA family oxidoreductase [Pseudomonadota bacterium]|nr:Gfo/Idh/MocA family oxidoreductase [Pseudomonadota bacterium]